MRQRAWRALAPQEGEDDFIAACADAAVAEHCDTLWGVWRQVDAADAGVVKHVAAKLDALARLKMPAKHPGLDVGLPVCV